MPAASPTILYDAFISCARKDTSLGAAPLDAALKPHCAVWRDIRGIDPVQDFTAEIEKAIKASRCVVVCLTPDVEREDSFVRCRADIVLWKLGDDRAVEALIAALRDPECNASSRALQALVKLGEPAAQQALAYSPGKLKPRGCLFLFVSMDIH